jgi:hypothetical protein
VDSIADLVLAMLEVCLESIWEYIEKPSEEALSFKQDEKSQQNE